MFKHNGNRIEENGHVVYDSDMEEDQALYTPEEENKVRIYSGALTELVEQNSKYNSNYNLWHSWDTAKKLWWIAQIEKQAADGLKTIGVDIVVCAVELQLSRK